MTAKKILYAYSKPRLIKTSLGFSSIFPHGKGLVTLELFLGSTGMKLKANVVQSITCQFHVAMKWIRNAKL